MLVADEFAASRAGIRAAIHPHLVVAEAADGHHALDAATRERPDVALMSLSLPGGALDTIRAIVKAVPGSRIVVLGDEDAGDAVVSALAAGAAGFLPRAHALERLPAVLTATTEGYALVPASLLRTVAERAERERRDALWHNRPRATFSRRERQVLEALREGASTADIAVALGLSAVTVRRYVSGVLRKAGVPNRDALSEMLGAGGQF